MSVSCVGSTESVNAEPAPAPVAVARAATAAIVSVHQRTFPKVDFIWPPLARGAAPGRPSTRIWTEGLAPYARGAAQGRPSKCSLSDAHRRERHDRLVRAGRDSQ